MITEYEGCSLLQPIAERLGLTIDLVNFLVSLATIGLLCIPLHSVRRKSKALLDLYCSVPSLVLMLVLFGWNTRIVLLQVGACYLLMRFTSERYCHLSVLVVSMSILAAVHFDRLFEEPNPDKLLDISYPLMMTTQKVSSLAFGLHDAFMARRSETAEAAAEDEAASGPNRTSEELREATGRAEIRRYSVTAMPDLLSYLCYVLFFPGILFGPFTCYPDFLDLYKELGDDRPSRRRSIYARVALCAIYGFTFLLLTPTFPVEWNKEPEIFQNWSMPTRFAYVYVSLFVCRMKFYFAWTIGEALHMAAGLGYNNVTRRWNKLRNVDPVKIEFATSPKTYIEAWNIQTALWLRQLAYWRLPRGLRTLSTFALSAIWHGFYPGYYATFLTGIPLTHAARKVRRRIRPWFQGSASSRLHYDLLTWFCTQLMMPSFATPFILLYFKDCIIFYSFNQFWCLHIMILLVLVLPIPHLRSTSATAPTQNPTPGPTTH